MVVGIEIYNITLFDQLDALCCNRVPFEEPNINVNMKKRVAKREKKRENQ